MSVGLDFLKDVKRVEPSAVQDAPRDREPIVIIQNEERTRPPAKSARGSGFQRTTVYLPRALYKRVKSKAFNEGRELSEIVGELLEAWSGGLHR